MQTTSFQANRDKEPTPWTVTDGLDLCILVEQTCVQCGFHVALAGGLATKLGAAKDCDLIFYPHKSSVYADIRALLGSLQAVPGFDFVVVAQSHALYGDDKLVIKAKFQGKPVDFIFPTFHYPF